VCGQFLNRDVGEIARARRFVEVIAAMPVHARPVQGMLRLAVFDGDRFKRAAGDMRHLDRMAIRMAADAAPGIRGLFALGRHCPHGGSREEARWQQGRMA
jgi:hypothetical protein